MAPATEKPEAPATAPPAAAAPHAPLFSPMAIIIVLVLLVVEGAAVFFLAKSFSAPKEEPPKIDTKDVEVELGDFTRVFVTDPTVMTEASIRFEVVLVLNPKFHEAEILKAAVEGKKNRLKDAVNGILFRKNRDYFYGANLIDELKNEIRDRVNDELGAAKDGHEIVSKVLFPKWSPR